MCAKNTSTNTVTLIGATTLSEEEPKSKDFHGQNLDNKVFTELDLKEADFSDCSLVNAIFPVGCDMSNAKFFKADLRNAKLEGVILTGANLDEAILLGANFQRANLTNATLQGSYAICTDFGEAELPEIVLGNMHVGIELLQGVEKDISVIKQRKAFGLFSPTNFSKANMTGALLGSKTYIGVNFTGANLSGCDCGRSNLQNARFQNANLEDTGFASATNLTAEQLAGANLENTKLPATIVFEAEPKQVDASIQYASKLYLATITICVFSLLILGSMTHADIVLPKGVIKLPFVDLEIPTSYFFWIGPLLVFVISFTFLFQLYRSWEAMMVLPAVYPDGKTVDRKVHPSLINCINFYEWVQLKGKRPPLLWTQKLLCYWSVYYLPPITLVYYWKRYLITHDEVGIAWHILLIALAFWTGQMIQSLQKSIAKGQKIGGRNAKGGLPNPLRARMARLWEVIKNNPREWDSTSHYFWLNKKHVLVHLASISIFAGLATVFRIGMLPECGVSSVILKRFHPLFRSQIVADLRDAKLAETPSGWIDNPTSDKERDKNKTLASKMIAQNLSGLRLEYARLNNMFLAGFSLQGAHLQGADLEGANLERAHLESADLEWAYLRGADLVGADLQEADLQGANLQGANLQEAKLGGADLQEANLQRADLQGAKLGGAKLQRADLDGADLRRAYLKEAYITQEQLDSAITDSLTKVSLPLVVHPTKPADIP